MSTLDEYRLVRCKYVRIHKLANNIISQALDRVSDNYGAQIAYIFDKAYNLSAMRAEVLELRKKVFLRRK